jgi:hypothetical protein
MKARRASSQKKLTYLNARAQFDRRSDRGGQGRGANRHGLGRRAVSPEKFDLFATSLEQRSTAADSWERLKQRNKDICGRLP